MSDLALRQVPGEPLDNAALDRIASNIVDGGFVMLTDATRLFDAYVVLDTAHAGLVAVLREWTDDRVTDAMEITGRNCQLGRLIEIAMRTEWDWPYLDSNPDVKRAVEVIRTFAAAAVNREAAGV